VVAGFVGTILGIFGGFGAGVLPVNGLDCHKLRWPYSTPLLRAAHEQSAPWGRAQTRAVAGARPADKNFASVKICPKSFTLKVKSSGSLEMTFVWAIDTGKFTHWDFSEMTPMANLPATPDQQQRPQPIGTSQAYSDWWKTMQDQWPLAGP
jgi:hypothetical protein